MVQLSQIHLLRRPYAPPEFVEQTKKQFSRHWRNPNRPRKPAKSEKEADRLRSRSAKRVSSGCPVFPGFFGFFSGINDIPGSKKGTDHSVPNPQSRKRPKRIFSGQSGLSPFLKGRTNLNHVNFAGRRRNRRLSPARRPRELTRMVQLNKVYLFRQATRTARIRRADEEKVQPALEESRAPTQTREAGRAVCLRSRFAKRDKFKPTGFLHCSGIREGWRTHSCVPCRHSWRHWSSSRKPGSDTSVTAARTSACATTTHSVRPHRPPEFVEQMEEKFGRHWRNPGRPTSVPGLRKAVSSGRPASVPGFRASTAFAVQKRGLTTLSPIHNLANVQSVSSVDRAVCPLF